jgi:hypothetical protein
MKRLLIACAIFADCALAQSGNPAITTGQYNSSRTAANLNETILNPSNVNTSQFGKLFSWPVDGWIFAQPLYVPGVQIRSTSRNVVYVATMHNSVYAFDADSTSGTPLWHVNLGTSVSAPTSNGCPVSSFTGPELGILSTPVIDPSSNTLYAVAATPSGDGYVHYLHALDITSGQEQPGSPVQIQASVPGTGYDSQSGTVTLSTTSTDIQRTALLLANGSVYAGFGNCGPDIDPWHGWVVAYSTANLSDQTVVFNSTPNGGQGGIWQSGRGLVVDASGSIYFTTGNATAYTTSDNGITTGDSTTDANNGNYPMKLIQLLPTGQFGASYPPANYAALNTYDLDFSSSGPLLIPGTNLLVAGGKDGVIYVFDPSNLAAPLQSFQATGTSTCPYSDDGCDQIHDLAFWNSTLYVWGSNDILRAYTFNASTNQFNTSAVSQNNTYQAGYYAPSMAISANSTQQGILWAVTADSIVHAFNASNLATELWNSSQNASRDGLPSFPKFVEPTVANGRVYVASHSNEVAIYGLLGGSSFVPVTPCRVADTRNSDGPFGGPVIAGQSSRDFAIPVSPCGIPPTAQAYALNVTVVPTGSLRFVTVWPSGQPQPVVSTLNSYDGRIKSNAAIMPAGTNGAITVFATDNTHVILDITGYFAPGTDTSGLAFYPLTPCRIADTREAAGPLGAPSMQASEIRRFPILSSSCNVPSVAQAYSLTFTVVPKGPLSFLTAWPSGKSQPNVSTLNAPTATVVANAAIIPAGTNGDVSVFTTNDTDVIIDINGYFAPPAQGGLSLYALTPCRVMDTRTMAGTAPLTGRLDVAVAGGSCAVPSAQAYVFNTTVVPSGSLIYLSLWPAGELSPVVSTLNAVDAAVTSNMAIVPAASDSISVYTSNPSHVILDAFGYFAP